MDKFEGEPPVHVKMEYDKSGRTLGGGLMGALPINPAPNPDVGEVVAKSSEPEPIHETFRKFSERPRYEGRDEYNDAAEK